MFIPVTRKHKIRYPKNYDPENPGKLPEPERWLPKWQRRRKGRKYQAKGSQGDALGVGRQTAITASTATFDTATEKKKGRK